MAGVESAEDYDEELAENTKSVFCCDGRFARKGCGKCLSMKAGLRCSVCKTSYCNRICQRDDWEDHKNLCKNTSQWIPFIIDAIDPSVIMYHILLGQMMEFISGKKRKVFHENLDSIASTPYNIYREKDDMTIIKGTKRDNISGIKTWKSLNVASRTVSLTGCQQAFAMPLFLLDVIRFHRAPDLGTKISGEDIGKLMLLEWSTVNIHRLRSSKSSKISMGNSIPSGTANISNLLDIVNGSRSLVTVNISNLLGIANSELGMISVSDVLDKVHEKIPDSKTAVEAVSISCCIHLLQDDWKTVYANFNSSLTQLVKSDFEKNQRILYTGFITDDSKDREPRDVDRESAASDVVCMDIWNKSTSKPRMPEPHRFSLLINRVDGLLIQAYHGCYTVEDWLRFDNPLSRSVKLPPPSNIEFNTLRVVDGKTPYRKVLNTSLVAALCKDIDDLRFPGNHHERLLRITGINFHPCLLRSSYSLYFYGIIL